MWSLIDARSKGTSDPNASERPLAQKWLLRRKDHWSFDSELAYYVKIVVGNKLSHHPQHANSQREVNSFVE